MPAPFSRRALLRGPAGAAAGLVLARPALAAASTGQSWADYAAQFVGAPYVYAGDTPDGWDCSGFTMFVAAHFGVTVDHGTAAQYAEGVPLDASQIQNGDFLYFANTFDSGISHVGIVTDAATTTMINALNETAGTVFSDYSTSYWQQHWYGPARFWGGSNRNNDSNSTGPNGGTNDTCADTGTSTTATANLNLRSGPGTSYAVLDVMPQGASLLVTGDNQNGFAPVNYQGACGWASAAYLTTDATPAPPPASGPTGGATLHAAADVHLRSGPGTSYPSLGVIAGGTTVAWDGTSQTGGAYTWDHVQTPLGTGWIADAFLGP